MAVRSTVLFAAVAALLASAAGSQDDDFAARADQRNTAHVRVCSELPELTLKAPALAEAGRFLDAYAIYERMLEKYPDTVVPLDKSRAVGIWDHVHGRLAAWPEEGKAFVRRRTDPIAEHRFQGAKRARDAEELEDLIERHPQSSVVKDALALIANLRLDEGQDERAAAALARLLAIEEGEGRTVALARLGLALSRLGRRDAVLDLAGRAEREWPEARVKAGGGETKLVDHLAALARSTRDVAGAKASLDLPSWETVAGGPAGWRLAEPGATLSRLAWSERIDLPRLDAEDELNFRRGAALVPTADFRPLFPVVSDGILYVHNGISLSAYNLFARQAERLWHYRGAPPTGEVMFDDRVIYAPAVHDGRVFAGLIAEVGGAEDQLGYVRVKFPFPKRALHAFDAYTGRPLWKLGGRLLKESIEEGGSFPSPPVPEGGRLYVGAVRQKLSTDPFEHYVLCVEAATGKVLWSTFVASGGTEINLFGNSTRESLGSPVSVDAEGVYYCTNHGVVAALDKRSGRLRWTYRYRQLPVMPTRSVYVNKNKLQWVPSPPVSADGVLAVTPTDSMTLIALDARTGEFRWDRPRNRDVRIVYGVRDGVLVLGGERLEFVDLGTGKAAAPPVTDELGGTGRGVAAVDGVYVPGRDKLRKVGWDGTWDESQARRWPGVPGEGGNLVIVDGAVILATQDSIQVFFDRRDQEESIRAALAKDPENPGLLYRGALRYLQSGEPDRAAALLEKVVAATASRRRPEDDRLHRAASKRLFGVSLEAGRGELELGRPEAAVARFEAARSHAPDPTARIEASLQLARVRLVLRQDARAVGEYQRLILQQGDDLFEGGRVFDLARNAVAAILTAAGRGTYAEHEESARALLAEARRGGTPDGFLKVFRHYPNSEAAVAALYEAAAAHARLGRGDDQAAALRVFLREGGTSAQVPQAHADLVRVLETKGRHAGAGALLRRMTRLFPDAPIVDGDARTTAREFAERRLKTDAYARPPGTVLPARLSPPLERRFAASDPDYPEGAPLRTAGLAPDSAAGLTLLQYARSNSAVVKAYVEKEGVGKEVWQVGLGAPAKFAAWLEDSLIVADDVGVVRIDPKTGEREWTYASPARMRNFALCGPHLLFVAADPLNEGAQQLVALDAQRGVPAWVQGFEGVAASRIFPAGEAAVFVSVSPNRIHLLEVETGRRLVDKAEFTGGLSAQVAYVADDVLVLHSEGRFLEAYDLPAGKLRWKVVLDRVSTRGLEAAGDSLVLLGAQRSRTGGADESFFLMSVSLRTGKILKRKDGPDVGDPRFLLCDGDRAYVVSRDPDPRNPKARSVRVRGVSLEDFSTTWSTSVGGVESTLLPPVLARDQLVLAMFDSDEGGRYGYSAVLLDKGGGTVQTISSGARYERPPGFGLANDRLVFSVDSKVDVYR